MAPHVEQSQIGEAPLQGTLCGRAAPATGFASSISARMQQRRAEELEHDRLR
jgi:hypothetical protein